MLIPFSLTVASAQMPFADVKESHWFYDEVLYVYQKGIFDGITPSAFEPNRAMTRAMFVQTLSNIDGTDLSEYAGESRFSDVNSSHWYTPAVNWAAEKGIASGVGNGRFDPNAQMTREQLVTMLYNYSVAKGYSVSADETALDGYTDKAKVSAWARDAMLYAVSCGLVSGMNESTLEPKGFSTRAQVARILMQFTGLYSETEPDIPEMPEGISIGSDRQLFLDDYIIDTEASDIALTNGETVKREAVFTFNKTYENEGIVLPNIVNMPDGSYRMYYTAISGRRRICYLESKDGLNWTRPNLRTNTYNGEKYTNIVTGENVNPAALYVFYDTNPAAAEKLKGIYGQWGDGLFLEHTVSGDLFEFWPNETMMMGPPDKSGGCFYDTLNTVYWDESRGQYVAFVRGFHEGDNYNLSREYVENNPLTIIRDTRVAFSDDCINWTTPVPVSYSDGADHQMYTNAVTPYDRAPGIYVGLPTRLTIDAKGDKWTDVFFMSSRDLLNWNRSQGPVLTEEDGSKYVYPDGGYPCTGFIQTSENELSFFMDEYDSSKKCDVLYRYTFRTDGFMAATGTKIETMPLVKEGDSLELNFEGQVKVTMTDASGNSVTSGWITGDEIAKNISFDGTLISDNVILTFEMKNAKLYSFKFN